MILILAERGTVKCFVFIYFHSRAFFLQFSTERSKPVKWRFAYYIMNNSTLQIIFEGVVGPTYLSDIAVDDIYFSKGTCCQLKQESFDAGLIGESHVTNNQINF